MAQKADTVGSKRRGAKNARAVPDAQTLLRDQLNEVLTRITADAPVDERVHAGRQGCKRLRALLRLFEPVWPRKVFRARDVALRDLGRTLAPMREAHVLARTLAGLQKHGKLGRVHVDPVAGPPIEAAAPLLRRIERGLQTAARVHETLFAAGAHEASPVETLVEGLAHTYRRARKKARRARENPTPEGLHAWRKDIKHHLYQLEALQKRGVVVPKKRVRALQELEDDLGKHHDLHVLTQHVAGHGRKRAKAKAAQRAGRLQRRALRQSRTAFADKPADVATQMRKLLSGGA